MENKTLTAVEWLINKIYMTDWETYNFMNQNEDFKQAKEMEKEQIKDAFVECWKANVPDGIECKLDAEQYYNETYKSK